MVTKATHKIAATTNTDPTVAMIFGCIENKVEQFVLVWMVDLNGCMLVCYFVLMFVSLLNYEPSLSS